MKKFASILLDLLIFLYLLALTTLLWTGGYSIDLGIGKVESHNVFPVLRVLLVLISLRILLRAGLKNFLLFAASVCFCLTLTEGVLRIVKPAISDASLHQIHQPSAIYDWELIPNSSGVGLRGEMLKINSLGFRGEDIPVEKPAPGSRIIVLGDSFTFGMSVGNEETFTYQLQALLSKPDNPVQVLNFGVIGYHMWQYLVQLESRVLGFQPDLVILGIYLDDILQSVPPYLQDSSWQPENPFEEIVANEGLDSSFRIVNTARNIEKLLKSRYRYKKGHDYLRGIEDRKKFIGPDNADHKYYRAQIGKLAKDKYVEFGQALDRISEFSIKHNVPVLLSYVPDASQLHEPDRQHINQFLSAKANALGVPFIDTTSELEKFDDPRELYLFPLDAHTSKTGNNVIARAILQAIDKNGLLDHQ